MKKKLIPLLLVLLLLLTACSPGNSERGKELGYFNYPGLDWGMTEEELFKALGKNESDFECREIDNERAYTLKDVEIFGQKGTVTFYIWTDTADVTPYLTSVTVRYENVKDFDTIHQTLYDSLKSQAVSIEHTEFTYRRIDQSDKEAYVDTEDELFAENVKQAEIFCDFFSNAQSKDLPEDMYEKARKGFTNAYGKNDSIFDQRLDGRLSTASFLYLENFNEHGDSEGNVVLIRMKNVIALIDEYITLAE